MGDVVRKGKSVGACFAPSETDIDASQARVFGLAAEGWIVDSYVKKVKGQVPTTVWNDRVPGPSLPKGSIFWVPDSVYSMFEWLANRNAGLRAQAQAFSDYFRSVGFKSAVPDIINQTAKEWYEIKPGSRTGLTAGKAKLVNIPVWMTKFGLPYKAGTAYDPGPEDDIDLLKKLPPGFRQFVKMVAAVVGGIVDIEIVLVFRRKEPGLILYWICVTLTFNDEAVDVDEVSDLVRNVARWSVIFAVRAGNGAVGDPQIPVPVTIDCRDATVQSCFVPGPRGLMGAVLRSPPAVGYAVLGGPLAKQTLEQRDRNEALAGRLFLPLPQMRPALSRGEASLLLFGGLVIVGLSLWAITALGQVEAAPLAIATTDAAFAAANALELEAASETGTVVFQSVSDAVMETQMERMLAQQALQQGLKLAGQTALQQGTRMALAQASASAMLGAVAMWPGNASAATAPYAPAGPSGSAAPPSPHVQTFEMVKLVAWLSPASPLAPFVIPAQGALAPRTFINLMGNPGIFLFNIAVTGFPELLIELDPAMQAETLL